MVIAMLLSALLNTAPASQPSAGPALKPGVKVFLHPMSNEFDTYFRAALAKKKVPVVVVDTRDNADFEIKGSAETQKAGTAKKVMLGSWHSDEQASITVSSVTSGEIVFAYSANKKNSAHGRQTTAEACAKHFREALETKK